MMRLSRITLGVFLCALHLSCGGSVPAPLAPDTVLYNAKIVTVDEDFSIAQAVAIKNGRFVEVGSNSQVLALAAESTEKIDLEGKTVLPGFYDGHVHVAGAVGEAPDPLSNQMREVTSIEGVVELVRQKVAATPPGELVRFTQGPGRAEQLKEKRWPTRWDLDPVSPDNPVLINRIAADYVWITNSQGLAAAGIKRNSPQPYQKGLFGRFQIDPKTKEPNGVVMGRAAQHILREALNVDSAEELEENIASAVRDHVIPYGITTYADPLTASNNQPTQHAYQRLMQREEGFPVRVNLMIRLPVRSLSTEANLDLIKSLLYAPPLGNDFLRVGTFKISLDKGRPGDQPYIVPAEKGKQVLIEAHKQGWQLYVHIPTPETFDYASEAMEEAFRLYPRQDARHIFTHIGMPTQENLQTMKRLGIIADLQVGRYYFLPDDAEERYQRNPARPDLGPSPVATYRDAGIPVTLSSDQAPIGPLYGIWSAVNRVRKSGKVFRPEERLTLEEAIRAYTITPAWAFFEDDRKGSIEVGKFADLVVLGKDILSMDPMEIKDIPVLRTMMDGNFVYVNPNQDPDQKVVYFRYPARISFLD